MASADLVLEAILRELQALRADLAAARTTVPGRTSNAEIQLLARIAVHAGGAVFSAGELAAHANAVQSDLAVAIVAACGSINARKIGKRLALLEGRELGGLLVQRVGADAAGVTWRVVSL